MGCPSDGEFALEERELYAIYSITYSNNIPVVRVRLSY